MPQAKHRLFFTVILVGIFFITGVFLSPFPVRASEPVQIRQASFEGAVLEITPCTNIPGFLITVASSSSQFIYQTGISKSASTGGSPVLGQNVSGVLFPGFVECKVANGNEMVTHVRQPILYYSSASSIYIEPPQTASSSTSSDQFSNGSANPNSFGGFSGLFSKLQNSLSSLFSGSGGQSSLSGVTNSISAGITSGGGLSITQPYGGIVLAAVPCTCSPGDFMITLGPPSAGTYLFSPKKLPTVYPYGLVIVPGVHHLGFYRPLGICLMVGTPCLPIPVTRGTITAVGTSLPGQ